MSALVAQLDAIYRASFRHIDLAERVRAALPPAPLRRSQATVVAIGKAAPAMLVGALERWGDFVRASLLVVPEGTAVPVGLDVEIHRTAHPLPDDRSERAGERILELARQADGTLLALVSGGASSLACAPAPGITTQDKREVTKALLESGASITAINTVRRHASRIKGGGVTRAAAPARTLALLVSDVIGGGPHDIGSGPTTPDPTTVDDARAVLLQHAYPFRALPLVETLKSGDPAAPLQRARIVAAPPDLAHALAHELAVGGFLPAVLEPSVEDVEALAAEYLALARKLPRRGAYVRAAEPSVRVRGPGKGGRSSHLAALVAQRLPPDVAFLAAASDGVDGSSGAGGAIVEAATVLAVGRPAWEAGIEAFDTAALHRAAGSALPGAASGFNLADVHALVRTP
jgi:hydroxypyruvate reductase